MIIRCEFITSCYVAKETHTSVEWPPHPARLFFALVSALHAFDEDIEEGIDKQEREALEWLEDLGNPTIYCPRTEEMSERKIVSHYVPPNDPPEPPEDLSKIDPAKHKQAHLPEFRGKKERAFPTLSFSPGKNTVFFEWKGSPCEHNRQGLERLFQRTSYLGHSSSLVSLGFADTIPDDPALVVWHSKGLDGKGCVLRGVSKGLLGLLETSYKFNEESQQNYRLPSHQVRYSTTTNEQLERPAPSSHFGSRWVVYRFPEWARVPITASLALTTNLKTEACRLADEAGDKISVEARAMLSGHKVKTGTPFEGPHVAWIALPYVGHRNASGLVFGVAAVLPQHLEEPEHRAITGAIHQMLHQIESLPFRGSTIKLDRVTKKTASLPTFPKALTAERWGGASKVWASVTPMALDRFPGFLFGRARKTEVEVETTEKALEEAKASIRQSCFNIGLPEPGEVSISKISWVEPCPPIHRFAPVKNASKKPRPVQAHVRLVFEEPVTGPVLLGRLRYLGMGLFAPLRSDKKGGAQ